MLAPCEEGAELPPAGMDLPLRVVTPLVKLREKAAEACRVKHAKLADWAIRVSSPE